MRATVLFLIHILCFLLTPDLQAQWHIVDVKTSASFRSVHTPNPLTCWAGGSNGTVVRTTNGGNSWEVLRVPDADSLDFRDVHAFDQNTAVVMSAGESEKGKARIYRTEDGGQTWQLVYQTTQKGIFLDGFDFWTTRRGICFGDPVDGRFFILTTQDGGRSWQELPMSNRPDALPGEAAFAASGTSLITTGKSAVYIGTGGSQAARVLRSTDYGTTWQSITTRLPAGPSSGIFGLRFWSKKKGIAVGGDYRTFTEATPNVLLTRDGGKTWQLTEGTMPPGLKEAVGLYYPPPFGKKNVLLMAVGASGSGYSADQGRTWVALDQHPFHAVSFAGSVGYAVGGKGLVAKWGE